MSLLTYNVNGVRAAMNKGLCEFLKETQADVVLLQETKATREQVDVAAFEQLGYAHHYWFSAEKKGYSGVAILSKIEPSAVYYGMNNTFFDAEGRVLMADIGDLSIISSYFPSGGSGEIRQALKMEFLDIIFDYLENLKKQKPHLIISGDYNICHREIDIHDPKGNRNESGFLPEERAWLDKFFDAGFIDVFRYFYPEKAHEYTWWSYRSGARQKNKGWRIDYHAATEPLRERLRSVQHFPQALQSDHCAVLMEIAM
ncbi:MAG: exodeoxyribonuclease III [Sphingobacteriales bacterium]|nr:exodeoxyribonuclease III [Sphingobacteriales bacterium]